MKINLITLTALLLATVVARAQNNDRIIDVKNDTIPCKIEGRNIFGAFKYSKAENGKTERISVTEFKEFYNADKTLWFRRVFFGNNRKIFMKVVARGKISIYETFIIVNGVESERWYASKNSDTAVFIQTDRLALFTGNDKGRKLFAGYLEDKKAVYDQYMEIKGASIDDMLRLAQLYNIDEHLK